MLSDRSRYASASQAASECRCPIIFGPRTGSKTPSFSIPRELPPGKLQALVPLKVARIESFRHGWKEEIRVVGVPKDGKQVTASHVTGVWKEWVEPVNNEIWSKGLDPLLRAEVKSLIAHENFQHDMHPTQCFNMHPTKYAQYA